METPIKSVAKISNELAATIAGTYAPGAPVEFNPVQDQEGNFIIGLNTAQYLEPGQFDIVPYSGQIVND